jgi:hypothetical protein
MNSHFTDNFQSSFEPFKNIPGYVNGNTNNRNQSLSVLNKGNNNIHNSIFTDLVNTNKKGFIVKKGTQFPDKLSRIDSHFVDNDVNTMSKCQDVCAKQDFCKAFTFNKNTKKCNTYNGIPNRMIGNADTNSGYKGNLSFDFAKLKPKQKTNIEKRIGSQYLMKRFNITSPDSIENFENDDNDDNAVEGYMNNDITKCLSLKKGPVIVNMKLILKVSNEKWSRSDQVNYIMLQSGPDRASNKASLNKYTLSKDNNYIIPLQFDIRKPNFDGFQINIGNNGLRLDQVKLILLIKDENIVLYNKIYNKGILIKNKSQYFGLDRKIDINKLAVNKIDYYIGSNNTDNEKQININNEKIDDILSSDKWSIEFNLKIDPNKFLKDNKWNNILLYGNNDKQRSPGIWLFPNNYRKVHFRFRSNQNWNEGFNFKLPNITNEFMNIKIDFIQTRRYYTYSVYVNGKRVERNNKRGYIRPFKNRNMFIKYSYDGKYNTRGYNVDNLTFTKEFIKTAILNKAVDANRKIMGYYADPKCIYNKVPETEDVYNRNLEEHDGIINDNIISESIDSQNKYGEQITEYKQQLADITSDTSLNNKLDNKVQIINSLASDDTQSSINKKNINLLQQKIDGSSIIESYTNSINNNSICYIVIILIMLIVLAFLIR